MSDEQLTQEEFTQLYNRLLRYAYFKATRYYGDLILRQDVANEAVNKAVDNWVDGQPIDEMGARRTIDSYLRQSSRRRKLEPLSFRALPPEVSHAAMHGYRIVE